MAMSFNARSCRGAFSLIELAAVLAIVSLVAVAALTQFGSRTIENLSADGFARRLALDLVQARRRTIATGDNHFLQLTPSAASPTAYTMYRRVGSGTTQVESARTRPAGVTFSATSATLEFDFDGAALAGYTATVVGPNRNWTISATMATGAVQTAASP